MALTLYSDASKYVRLSSVVYEHQSVRLMLAATEYFWCLMCKKVS